MQSLMISKVRLFVSVFAALVLCLALAGCSNQSAQDSSESSASTSSPVQNAPTSNAPAPSEAEPQAPLITTAYLQEGSFGENNVVAFLVTQREDEITSARVFYGNVEVTGNSTIKRNYTMSTTTVANAQPEACELSFSSGEGSFVGLVGPASLAGTFIIPGVGEFAIDAPAVDSKQCTSCLGSGSGIGSSASSSCSSCNGVGYLIAYKGTYI